MLQIRKNLQFLLKPALGSASSSALGSVLGCAGTSLCWPSKGFQKWYREAAGPTGRLEEFARQSCIEFASMRTDCHI